MPSRYVFSTALWERRGRRDAALENEELEGWGSEMLSQSESEVQREEQRRLTGDAVAATVAGDVVDSGERMEQRELGLISKLEKSVLPYGSASKSSR